MSQPTPAFASLPRTLVGRASSRRATARAGAAGELESEFWPLFMVAFRAAHRVLGNQHAAEDAASEALARTHLHWKRVGTLPHREAWVARVAINQALTLAAKRHDVITAASESTLPFEDGVATRLQLLGALRRLPRRQQEVVALRVLVGLAEGDVAATLGIGAGSVRKHMDRGLRALRADYHESSGGNDDNHR